MFVRSLNPQSVKSVVKKVVCRYQCNPFYNPRKINVRAEPEFNPWSKKVVCRYQCNPLQSVQCQCSCGAKSASVKSVVKKRVYSFWFTVYSFRLRLSFRLSNVNFNAKLKKNREKPYSC